MTSAPSATVRFLALGPADLSAAGPTDAASILQRPKLLALFSYLVVASTPGFQRRDTLVGLFWAEMDQERARAALRQALYYLRQFLGEGVLVTRGDDEIGIAAGRVWSDVAAFGDALARGASEEALERYRGDLLEGLYVAGAPEFERWLEQRREELRRQARQAAWDLAVQAQDTGNGAAAARWAREASRLARYDEGVLRQVVQLLDHQGDRAGALREYELFAKRLRDDLDVEPAPETRSLVDHIRRRDVVGIATRATPPLPGEPESPPVASHPPADAGRWRRLGRYRYGMLGGAAVIVTVVAVWGAVAAGRETALDRERVVVAVFENLTGEPALDPIGRMAADWLTQGLDQLAVIEVVPSTGGMTSRPDFRSQGSAASGDIRTLARATGAGTVVSGTYYLRGDSLGFQAQVIDARDGRLLRAVPPVVGLRDAPGILIDTLRQFVTGTVATVFDSRLSPVLGGRPPSVDAYRAYLEGYRAFFRIPSQSLDAIAFLSQAITLDSAFLDPRILLVFAQLNVGNYAAADSHARFLVGHRARMTAGRRHVLDYQLALVRGDRTAALAASREMGGRAEVGVEALRANHLHEAVEALRGTRNLEARFYQWVTLMDAYHMLGAYEHELREAQRARAVYPEQSAILEAQLRALVALGRIDEVRRGIEAGQLLPTAGGPAASILRLNTAGELRAHGYREVAFELADQVIAWYRARAPAGDAVDGGRMVGDRWTLANAHYLREQWDAAEREFRTLAAEAPDDVDFAGFLGVLAARQGRREGAERISRSLTGRARPGDFGRDLYWQACIAAQLGQRERAVGLLRDAYGRGRLFSVMLHRDMDLEPLRDFPPFQQFLRSRD